MNVAKKRNITVDVLKAFCIVLVVIGHFAPDNAPDLYKTIVDVIYSFHMPAFMWASGFLYIMTMRPQSYFSFIGRKLRRLMLPYLVVSLVVICLKLLSQRNMYVEHPITTDAFYRMFYLPEAGYFLWFLWALMFMFLIAPFFRTQWSRILLFIFSSILSTLTLNITSVFCLDCFVAFLPYFSLGMCSADVYKGYCDYLHKSLSITLLLVLSLVSIAVFVALSVFLPDIGGLDNLLIAIAGIICILSFSELLTLTCSDLSWMLAIADASFLIYLFHTTFQGIAKSVIFKLSVTHYFIVDLVAMTVIGCLGPFLMQKFILSKFKWTRFCFSLSTKRTFR